MIGLLVSLILIGLLLWVVDQLPIDGTIKRVIHIVVIVLVVLWLISIFFGGIDIPLPRFR